MGRWEKTVELGTCQKKKKNKETGNKTTSIGQNTVTRVEQEKGGWEVEKGEEDEGERRGIESPKTLEVADLSHRHGWHPLHGRLMLLPRSLGQDLTLMGFGVLSY